MGKKEKAYSVAVASTFIIFLILVSSMASAYPEQNFSNNINQSNITNGVGNSFNDQFLSKKLSTEENDTASESIQVATPKITETRITTSGSAEKPSIYKEKVVWQDYRSGNWDIYVYDLSTHQETHTTNKSDQTQPAIYDNKVVWTDSRNGGSEIYLQDLSTKKQTRITTSGLAYNPAIYRDKIVWQDERNGKDNIYIYDLSTSKENQITTSGSAENPSIYEDRVVWDDWRNGNQTDGPYNIYMYNLSTHKETQVTNSGSAAFPAVYGDRIVWVDWRNVWYEYDIYTYDLSTHKEKQIATNGDSPNWANPAIYGNWVIWEGEHNGEHDVYVYDLSTSKETRTASGSAYLPAIYGNRIVWEDWRNGNNIYMGTLSSNSLDAAFSASPVSGKAPLKVQFTDKSTGSPTSWKWSFGDKTYSTAKNPAHIYNKAGKYTVTLTVKDAKSSSTKIISEYITVSKK